MSDSDGAATISRDPASRTAEHRANGDAVASGPSTTQAILVFPTVSNSSNAPLGTGLFGSSSLGDSFAKLDVGSTPSPAFGKHSFFKNAIKSTEKAADPDSSTGKPCVIPGLFLSSAVTSSRT